MNYIQTQTLENIPEYVIDESIDSNIIFSDPDFTEDVIDENLLDDWNIDDFLIALPKTIEYGIDNIIYSFKFIYNDITSSWNICYYNKDLDKSIFTISSIDPYECFKQIYSKLKIVDKL